VTRPNGQVYQPRALADMPDVEALRTLRDAGVPALPYGPPGTGKTSLVEAAFPDLITVAGVGDTTAADLVGEFTQKPGRHLHLRIRAAHHGHAGGAGPLHRRRHLGQPGGAGGRLPRDGRSARDHRQGPPRAQLDACSSEPFDGGALGTLSYANRRRVEIARALALQPKLLVLDEPTAGMNPSETAEVRAQLLELKTEGQAILLVAHKLDLVMTVSDRVIVMDNGRIIAQGDSQTVRRDPAVIEAYLGRRRVLGGEAAE
jgi:Branched-chain amino acid ATP-binding cassette transporter/ABC transporter